LELSNDNLNKAMERLTDKDVEVNR